ncbi:MAG: Bug family tripartite tricarboxylate transporter substrate binding protein [Lautropia sp.]
MKKLFATLGLGCAVLLAAGESAAQQWPDRPVKLVVGAPPGGAADFVARYVSDKLTRSLGQAVVVENRPGAGGVVAVKSMLGAKPDGYTLLLFFADNFTIAPQLAKTPPYDSLKDVSYIGAVARSRSFFVAVHPSVPAQTFEEFVKLAKGAPGKVTYATYGLGTFPHLSFEMLVARAGIDMVHVPYKGGVESQQAVVAGDVNAVAAINIVELIKAGRLRALALGGAKRSEVLPLVPTLAELGYGEEVFGPVVYGVAAPAAVPPAIIERLSREVRNAAEAADGPEKLNGIASEPYWASGEQMRTMVRQASASYAPIIQRLSLAK